MSERQLFTNQNNHVPHVAHSVNEGLVNSTEPEPTRKWTLPQKIHLSITISLLLLCFVLIAIYIRDISVTNSLYKDGANSGLCNTSNSHLNGQRRICYRQSCIESAANILNNVDGNVNPCNDFYNYACGGWFRKNIISDKQQVKDKFSVLEESNFQLFKQLLEGDATKFSVGADKLRLLYNSCKNDSHLKTLGSKPLSRLIRDCDCHADFSKGETWDIVFALFQVHRYFPPFMYGAAASPLFETKVIVDKTDSSKYILQISQPDLMRNVLRQRNLRKFEEIKEQRGRFLKSANEFIKTLYKNQTSNFLKIKKQAQELHANLIKVSASPGELRNVKQAYRVIKVSQLNKETGKKFPWLRYLNMVLKPVGMKFNRSSYVAVKPLSYIKAMVNIIHQAPNETLNYYILRSLVNAFSPYIMEQSQKTPQMVSMPRWKQCIKYAEEFMGMALGSLFIKNYFPTASLRSVKEMVEEIKKTFIENLKTIDWMDEMTKKEAKGKANNMGASIGYPEFLNDDKKVSLYYSGIEIYGNEFFQNIVNLQRFYKMKNLHKLRVHVDRDEWIYPPTLVNGFYDDGRNKMLLFAGILQHPFYTWKAPMSLNYGTLGTVMGHEFSHGFDDQGRLYDSNGNINDWWTPESSRNFEKKATCIRNQYSGYSYGGIYLNGNASLGENMADNAGLKIAFKAFQRWRKRNGKDTSLPGVNFTSEQLFFLGYAQMWCSITSEQVLMSSMRVHPPNMFRILGTLSNSQDFAKAFQCKSGSRMNPEKKCTIW